ncbi:MAG: hypothetical protein HWN67_03200 [Candidatus Helarchaeota archaeon]|nr:hypothetical protein [Candidatus Helarchaeota archaeon]
MSSIRESLSTLKNVFFSTWKMKIFSLWLIIAVFLEVLIIGASRNEIFIGFVNFNFVIKEIKNQTNQLVVFISVILCAISMLIFWLIREKLTKSIVKWEKKPSTKFILFGSLGALWVEFIFWLVEKLFGTEGVAASPNLIVDWLATMPWYIMMIALIWKINTRYTYSLVELALFGGIYELCADGVLGLVFKGQAAQIILLPLIFPIFVIVYSYMILPPTILTRNEIEMANSVHLDREDSKKFKYGLLPLIGLIPYIFLFILMI